MQAHQIRPDFTNRLQRALCRAAGALKRAQGVLPGRRIHAFRHGPGPTQLGGGIARPRSQTQIPCGMLGVEGDLLPIKQSACLLQAADQQVAGEVRHLSGGQLTAEKLHARLVELMRFIKNNGPH